jgi:hypothetical protein
MSLNKKYKNGHEAPVEPGKHFIFFVCFGQQCGAGLLSESHRAECGCQYKSDVGANSFVAGKDYDLYLRGVGCFIYSPFWQPAKAGLLSLIWGNLQI